MGQIRYPHGKPILQALPNDSNRKELQADFMVIDKRGRIWKVPKGYITDGASIPESLEPFIGDPFAGVTEPAAVVHDYFCDTQERSQKDTHRVFRELIYHEMRVNSEYSWFSILPQNNKIWQYQRCKLMWAAVRIYNRIKHKDWK